MPESAGFIAFVTDLLSLLGPIRVRAMFGGHGIYFEDLMMGLIDDDELFLKTDDQTISRFVAAGCRQWEYPSKNGPMKMSYYRPPDGAHEDAEAMLPSARLAVGAARRALAAKTVKAMKGSGKVPATKKTKTGAAAKKPGRGAKK